MGRGAIQQCLSVIVAKNLLPERLAEHHGGDTTPCIFTMITRIGLLQSYQR